MAEKNPAEEVSPTEAEAKSVAKSIGCSGEVDGLQW